MRDPYDELQRHRRLVSQLQGRVGGLTAENNRLKAAAQSPGTGTVPPINPGGTMKCIRVETVRGSSIDTEGENVHFTVDPEDHSLRVFSGDKVEAVFAGGQWVSAYRYTDLLADRIQDVIDAATKDGTKTVLVKALRDALEADDD